MNIKTKRLAALLSMSGIDGCSIIAAATGFFKFANIILISFLFIAGPGAIILATFLDGNLKERVFSALFAGILATSVIILAAGFGPRFVSSLNMDILKLFGGVAIISVGILTIGIKIPEKFPFMIIILGLILSIIGGILR